MYFTATQAQTSTYASATRDSNTLTVTAPPVAGQTLTGNLAQKNFTGISFVGTTVQSGVSLAGSVLSGANFTGATLSGVDLTGVVVTGTNFTNANIVGATNLPAFSTTQKLQLLRNTYNVAISAIQIDARLSGSDINAAIASPVSEIANATFTVKAPTYNGSGEKVVTVISSDVSGNASIYVPLNADETVKINDVAYTFDGTNLLVNASANNSINFDGYNDYINYGVVSAFQIQYNLTLECWFKTSSTSSNYGNIIAKWVSGGNASDASYAIGMYGGKFNFKITDISNGFYEVNSVQDYNDNVWHHGAGTYDSSTKTLLVYIDGVLNNSYTNASIDIIAASSTRRLIVGSDDAGAFGNQWDRQYSGSLAEARVWNVTRTSTQIYQNYQKQLIGNETGLVVYNRLNQGTAGGTNSSVTTTTNNMLSGGYSGTLGNFALSGSTSNWVAGPTFPGSVIHFITVLNIPYKLYAGSIIGLNLLETMNRVKIAGTGLYDMLLDICVFKN